jgi:hypothetical protein
MKKIILTVIFLAGCLGLSACGQGKPADYLIKAGADNGFTAASRSYFAIDGNNISKISKRIYEKNTLGSQSLYERIHPETYQFDIDAPDTDPENWIYTENEFDSAKYDTAALKSDLKQMGANYSGSIYLLINVFDSYRIIEVHEMNGNVVTKEVYAIFNGTELLDTPQNTDLSSLREFYRLK